MKKLFILTILLFILTRGFPQQTPEELQLRKQAGFKELYKEIAANKKENCLCTPSEQVIFSFQTITGKIASLCISKAVSEKSGFFIYRFGTPQKTEFTFPSDTLNSFSRFTFSFYSRGGGKQNLALELNGLEFINNEFTYKLCDDYTFEDNKKSRYIIITNIKTKKENIITGRKNIIGGLYYLRDANIVKFDPDTVN